MCSTIDDLITYSKSLDAIEDTDDSNDGEGLTTPDNCALNNNISSTNAKTLSLVKLASFEKENPNDLNSIFMQFDSENSISSKSDISVKGQSISSVSSVINEETSFNQTGQCNSKADTECATASPRDEGETTAGKSKAQAINKNKRRFADVERNEVTKNVRRSKRKKGPNN